MMASRLATGQHHVLQAELTIMEQGKGMSRVMTMRVFQEARDAKVIVLTVTTGNHFGLVEF